MCTLNLKGAHKARRHASITEVMPLTGFHGPSSVSHKLPVLAPCSCLRQNAGTDDRQRLTCRQDDVMRTRLRSLLASLQPAEVVLRKTGDGHDDLGAPSSTTLKVHNPMGLQYVVLACAPLLNHLWLGR